jgi:hypothetical protein
LAAFYYWSDRQSLLVAVQIALRTPVNMSVIKNWSAKEGFERQFADFQGELKRARRTHRR